MAAVKRGHPVVSIRAHDGECQRSNEPGFASSGSGVPWDAEPSTTSLSLVAVRGWTAR